MVFVVFLTVVSVFVLTFLIVTFSLIRYNTDQADGMTQVISTYDGAVPQMKDYKEAAPQGIQNPIIFNEESAFRTRYFVVYFNDDRECEQADLEHVASVDEETACEMAAAAISGNQTVGYMDTYRFRITQNSEGENIVIFLDCSESITFRHVTVMILAVISVLFILLITFIFAICSKRVLRPFEENTRKQKQFITDASHELKTPLAIISANAEVLEYKDGKNEWIGNITEQVHHMSELVDELLILSKMEELDGTWDLESVNLSDVVNETIDSFGEVFRKKQVQLQSRIDDVIVNGNVKQLTMLISILVENASKYVTDRGVIKISLRTTGKAAVFQIYNTAQLADSGNLENLFDRFYRPDGSRTSLTGGHGIGLSIAKKITSLHSGSISVEQVEGGICFTAEISSLMKGNGKRKNKRSVIT